MSRGFYDFSEKRQKSFFGQDKEFQKLDYLETKVYNGRKKEQISIIFVLFVPGSGNFVGAKSRDNIKKEEKL